MVCDKCQKKLGSVITPDTWKDGARNTTESGGRKINENKLLTSKKNRFNPYTTKFVECRICRTKVHQAGSNFCQGCAYKKGICAMCGKKIIVTRRVVGSAVCVCASGWSRSTGLSTRGYTRRPPPLSPTMNGIHIITANGKVRNRLPSWEESREIWRSADAVCFDVDSTVIVDEGLDQLAMFCGKAEEVKKLTVRAMQGGMEFRTALRTRLDLLQPRLDMIQKFTRAHPPKLTKDIDRLVAALQARDVDVYLVSGGFRSLIAPVAKMLNIPLENIFANRLKFFFDGEYGGFDEAQLTSKSGGKAEVITYLKKREGYSHIVMIGDGATDMEACPPADAFIGFGGNIVREAVRNTATWFVYDFASLIDELESEDL